MGFEFRRVAWPFATPFKISYKTQTEAEGVVAEITDGCYVGRGEGFCVSYRGETPQSLLTQLSEVADILRSDNEPDLYALLPPGGARNAIDCAFWDLRSKKSGRRAWALAGIQRVRSLVTAFTLSVDSPAAMALAAASVPQFELLKLKLAGDGDLERVAAVRSVRPDADLIVDANQAWSVEQLYSYVPSFKALGVKLIEQPLPVGADEALADYESVVALCADESAQTSDSIGGLVGKYSFVNIKLDKTGGLTEAIRMADVAQAAGLKLMVGCMAGSSIAMAPAFIIGQRCDIVDLDGPLLATCDVPNGIKYVGSRMSPPGAILWG